MARTVDARSPRGAREGRREAGARCADRLRVRPRRDSLRDPPALRGRGGAPRNPPLRRRRRAQRPPGVHPGSRGRRREGGPVTRVVVLGAGIAGLTAAFRRASAGETTVLEAGPRAGGSIRTIREDGFTLECGPNTLRTTESAERLLADLGIEREAVAADSKAPRWIVRGGSPRAVVPGPAALFNKVFSTNGKLRLLKDCL